MDAPAASHADTIPVRLLAERLHRLDVEAAWCRSLTAPDSLRRHAGAIRHAAARRALVQTIEAAQGAAARG
jgi:hypothetical protein